MSYWVKMASAVALTAMLTTGCSLFKKAASGQSISGADLVAEGDQQNAERKREADRQAREEERRQDKIKRIETQITEDLQSVEEQRKNGRFSSAEYREKRIHKKLAELKEIDAGNAMLASAPEKLQAIKGTWTEDVYNKRVLTEKCSRLAERTKQDRMDERWSGVERGLTAYVKCRRKMKDAGVGAAIVQERDQMVLAEYDAYAAYVLGKIAEYRKASEFRYAVSFETGFENHLKYYAELAPTSGKPDRYAKKIARIQKKYRDPEEVKAERARADFESWRKRVTEQFDSEWDKIQTAERAAQSMYEQGENALDAENYKTAEKKLLSARQTLYKEAYSSAVALDAAYRNGSLEKGLSYQISSALARLYFEQGDKAKLYPELSIIKNGRPWLSKDEELKVRLFDILADRRGKMQPKPTDTVRRFAGRYSKIGKEFKAVKEVAIARRGEAYGQIGVEVETISHRQAGSNPTENVGKIVYVEEPVTAVSGSSLRFDVRSSYSVPTKCRNTKQIDSVNVYTGQVYYKQKCKYKKVKSGYSLIVKKPRGVKITKGDLVAFYAAVGKKQGKFDLNLNKAGFVRIAPGGQTAWFLGARVK